MHTELFTLSRIFTDNLFRIPDYQRGYSWTERQLKDFWSDLSLLVPDRDHYTGVITVEEVTKSTYSNWKDDLWIIEGRKYVPYYVVDGQQRLTTSLIFIQTIVEYLERISSDSNPDPTLNYSTTSDIRRKFIRESKDKGISHSYIFGYEKDNPSYEFLKTRIFNQHSDNHSVGEETIYTQNLAYAKTFFELQLKDQPHEHIAELYKRLTQHFLYNIYTIAKGIDVFVAFETMNNRGKPLSDLELMKNRLIYLSTRVTADDNNDNSVTSERRKLRSSINEAWKEAYHYLGKNSLNPLDDNEFLTLHFARYFENQLRKEHLPRVAPSRFKRGHFNRHDFTREYLLNQIFTTRNIEASDEHNIHLSVNYIYDYAADLKKFVKLYYEIMNPDSGDFSPDQKMWLTRLNRLGWNDALLLALIAAEQVGVVAKSQRYTDFLRELERNLFIRPFTKYWIDVKASQLWLLSLELQDKKESIDAVISLLAHHTNEVLKKAELATSLGNQAKDSGFYGWRNLRYFLFEYEQNLRKKAKDKLDWQEFSREDYETDYLTIEHIYPQKATNAYWKTRFSNFKPSQKTILRNSIGNLVPLSRPKNSALSNKSFPDKKDGTGDYRGYTHGCHSEIEVAQAKDWTANEILRRGIRMLTFMEERWQITIGNEKDKQRALGLTFVNQ